MFERYTEKARRVIFFARYEASHFGVPENTRRISTASTSAAPGCSKASPPPCQIVTLASHQCAPPPRRPRRRHWRALRSRALAGKLRGVSGCAKRDFEIA